MRCLGRHLLVLLVICPALFTASFMDCAPFSGLERFWSSPSYIQQNPNIYKALFFYFYSFDFDNTTQSLQLQEISLADGDYLAIRLPNDRLAEFSEANTALDKAQESIESAKISEELAHEYLIAAKKSVDENPALHLESSNVYTIYLSIFDVTIILDAIGISEYINFYPILFSETLENSANAYDSLNTAARILAQKTHEQHTLLKTAGAGLASYSGKAKQTLFYADSLLLPDSGFCIQDRQNSEKIAEYFASRPNLPDFSQQGFSAYMQSIGGKNENSTIIKLASLYSLLDQANKDMQQEYAASILDAQSTHRSLLLEIKSIGSKDLQLIGDSPHLAQEAGAVLIGMSYTGIYSGVEKAKQDETEAKAALDSAKASVRSTEVEGYLANAISHAKESEQISSNAISSLAKIRADAQSAVSAQKQQAESAIAKAQEMADENATVFSDAQAIAAARQLLSDAKVEFLAAESHTSLGKKFESYTNAARLSFASIKAYEGKATAELSQSASKQLHSLSELISLAEKDGLDVEYEKDILKQYQELASLSQKADILVAISDAAQDTNQVIILRLYEKYSHLDEKYLQLSEMATDFRKADSSFLPEFDLLNRYFSNGKLNAESAAGQLMSIESKINSYLLEGQALLPKHLSTELSKNAQVFELTQTPVLGQKINYSATITTENPAEFSFAGKIIFTARTSVPLYLPDFVGGDKISDSFYDEGKTNIELSEVLPYQRFFFSFESADQPAQLTSSYDICSIATEQEAQINRKIEFFSSRALGLLSVAEPAPNFSSDAHAAYSGKSFPLSAFSEDGKEFIKGTITDVKQGKNSLEISFRARHPFEVVDREKEYETLQQGAKKVSYIIELSGISVDCPTALVSIAEPFLGISNFAATSLGQEEISDKALLHAGSTTYMRFSLSPLMKNTRPKVLISYTIKNSSSALEEALAQAELQVAYYNSTKDALLLSEAKALAAQNKSNQAMEILSSMRKQAEKLSYSNADYQLFLHEKSVAEMEITASQSIQAELLGSNLTEAASQLSSAIFEYSSSVSLASDEADAKGYAKALSGLRKARTKFHSSIALLSSKNSALAAKEYAKARKDATQSEERGFSYAQQQISESQRLYSQGELSLSLLSSARARHALANIVDSRLDTGIQQKQQAEKIREQFSGLLTKTQELLSTYSSQHSSLSGQSKKQLAITPSAAQKKITDAQKLSESSSKPTRTPQDSLSQANKSYQDLLSVHQLLENSLSSLQESASSSLRVAKIALSEVLQKAGEEDEQQAQQINDEVSKAESFLANLLYADSLMSSERAIRSSNSFLEAKQNHVFDVKSILIAAISIAFVAAAAYYFFKRQKQGKKEKKELPKEEQD